jgi:hypothetical protein
MTFLKQGRADPDNNTAIGFKGKGVDMRELDTTAGPQGEYVGLRV